MKKVGIIGISLFVVVLSLNLLTVNAQVQWSEWVDELPEEIDEAYETEERTLYKYRDKSHKTSTSSSMEGWTKEKDPTTTWGSWSAWQDAAVSASSTRKVETRVVGNGTYSYKNNPGEPYPIPTRNLISGRSGDDVRWAQKFLNEVRGAGLSFDGVYGSATKSAVRSFQNDYGLTADGDIGEVTRTKILDVWRDVTKTENQKTQYRYQDATVTYYYYKWSEWSEWSDEEPEANDDREIETKTQYRYRRLIEELEEVQVSGLESEYTYTGDQIKPEVILSKDEVTLVEGEDYTVEYSDNVNVGAAALVYTGIGNYSGTIEKTFSIVPADIQAAQIALGQNSYVYSGNENTPSVTVTLVDKELVADTDYTVSYSNNVAIGTASVTVSGQGNYTGRASKTFTIAAKDISAASVLISQDSYTYTGKYITPNALVMFEGKQLVQNTDYRITYNNNVSVGTAELVVNGIGEYGGKAIKTFTIEALDVANSFVELERSEYTYSGKKIVPVINVSLGNNRLDENIDYSITYKDNINVGTSEMLIKGKGNYIGQIRKTFSIVAADINDAIVTLSQDEYTYDGQAFTPEVTVEMQNTKLADGTDFEVEYKDNIDPGNAEVLIKGTGNYTGEKKVTFIIANQQQPTTQQPTTQQPTTQPLTTEQPTTQVPTTESPAPVQETAQAGKVSLVTMDEQEEVKLANVNGGTDSGVKIKKEEGTTSTSEYKVSKGTVFESKKATYKVTDAKKKAVVYVASNSKGKTEVKVPDTIKYNKKEYKVTEIEAGAFKNNKKLKKLVIGRNIKKIGKNAFRGCKNLKSVTIGKNVVSIGSYAFYGDKKLSVINFGTRKLNKVGKGAFKKISKHPKAKVPREKLYKYQRMIKKAL